MGSLFWATPITLLKMSEAVIPKSTSNSTPTSLNSFRSAATYSSLIEGSSATNLVV